MSYPQFFCEHQTLSAEQDEVFSLALSSDDVKHARVLRIAPGEIIAVIDASSDYFLCEVCDVTRDGLRVRIASREEKTNKKWCVRLFQGLSKGDRFETVLRHATELGVDEFIPLVSERTVVKLDAAKLASKLKRWQAIAKSAAMQSGRRDIPTVLEPQSIKQLGELTKDDAALLIFWEEDDGATTLHDVLAAATSNHTDVPAIISLVIGPEGGFSSKEIEDISKQENAHVLTLGDTILRTETAGLVASALVIYELGGLGNASVLCESRS